MPTILKKENSQRKIFYIFLIFRVINALFINSYFNPDEHWQSIEVAHNLIYSYQDDQLTWEWTYGRLRSWCHPLLFAIYFKILNIFNFDYQFLIVHGPRVFIMPIFASIYDYYIFKINIDILDYDSSSSFIQRYLLVILSTCNWFVLFMIPRTYSSSVETVFFTVGLYYFLKHFKIEHLKLSKIQHDGDSQNSNHHFIYSSNFLYSVFFSSIAIILRPTHLIISGLLYTPIIVLRRINFKTFFLSFLILFSILLINTLIDSIFYREITIVPLEFMKFNLINQLSDFYGTHPTFWYMTSGMPFVLSSWVLLLLCGIYYGFFKKVEIFNGNSFHKDCILPLSIFISIFYCIILSFSPHKEFRFLLPILPLIFITISILIRDHVLKIKNILKYSIIIQFIFFIFFSNFHQIGPDKITRDIRNSIQSNSSIFYLSGCHSTPYIGSIHRLTDGLKFKYLKCEPNLLMNERNDFLFNFDLDKYIGDNVNVVVISSAFIYSKEDIVEKWLIENKFKCDIKYLDGIWAEGPKHGDIVWFPNFKICMKN